MVQLGIQRHRLKFYHLTEASIRLCLLLLFLELEERAPFIRKVQPEEIWLYRNPMTESYVPGNLLWKFVTFVPLTAILVCYAVFRDKSDLTAATLVTTLAMPLNGVITDIVKLCVGRCRPDFVYRCWSDGVVPEDAFTSEYLNCSGNPAVVMEGRKSFPSGHSSFSFVAWGFVFFYLSGKLGTFHHTRPTPTWKLLLPLVFLVAPLTIALSRTADYHHHWQDVVVGSLLGFGIIWMVYRQHYPPLTSPHSAKPLGSIPANTAENVNGKMQV
eukprot:GFUD01001138.1.p1 GENE.GFUD01001138.1~~GFUD01001138.1.p1  ORF type:complete len:271 (+),score=24.12 GFUD01001138.1:65-877(+)